MKLGKKISFKKGLPKSGFSPKTARRSADSVAKQASGRVNAFAKKTKAY
jgi:hypothetical protein